MIYLFLAGRGAGKSRSGAEWTVESAILHPRDRHGVPTEGLVIAETLSDARTICFEGPSGILNVLNRKGLVRDRDYFYKQTPKTMILFPEGNKIFALGADDEDVGRGYNAAYAWLDELAKFPNPYGSWYEGIMPSLRADLVADHPRAFVTTTPKPIKIIKEWLDRDDGSVHVITGSTYDNAANLSSMVLAELRTRYEGTSLGEQELYGRMVELGGGGLFKRADIARYRVQAPPDDLVAIAVGVDPNLTGDEAETGLVVVGRCRANELWVLADLSIPASGREAAIAMWRAVAMWRADVLVYETNLGKRWMTDVMTDAYRELCEEGLFPTGTTPPGKGVDSKHGKKTRAEPVAMRLEQGRLHFVGTMPALEDQAVLWDPVTTRDSPDRLDAMVHAARHLMAGEKKRAGIASPSRYQLPSRDAGDTYDGY